MSKREVKEYSYTRVYTLENAPHEEDGVFVRLWPIQLLNLQRDGFCAGEKVDVTLTWKATVTSREA